VGGLLALLVAVGVGVGVGVGCGTPTRTARAPARTAQAIPTEPCKEPERKVVLRGSDRMNVDEFGQSLAVVVRVYQLRTAKTLEDAEFDHIWQHDRESLADDVISADEVTLAPTEVRVIRVKRSDEARYVAVIGLFRRPDGIAWRAIRLIPTVCRGEEAMKKVPKEIALEFLVEDYRIEVRS
jgi:type VI secretion system protein VasD